MTTLIWDALLLSRLVRDNSCSTTYAARVVEFDNDERVIIYTLFPEAKAVYRVRRDRDWLDPTEGRELAELAVAYWEAETHGLPGRISRALSRAESASWQRTGDTILPVLVSGLESLLKTERHQATQQFVIRCQALASELGVNDVTEAFLREMYDGRSDWVHGATVKLFAPDRAGQERRPPTTDEQWQVFDQIARLQLLLRSALRRSFEDGDFRAVFADDDLIRERWPI